MTINFFSRDKKISKMGDFQEVKHIEGLQVSSVSADLYKNGRDDLSISKKVAYDEEYMQKKSLLFDLKILWMTLLKVLNKKGISH